MFEFSRCSDCQPHPFSPCLSLIKIIATWVEQFYTTLYFCIYTLDCIFWTCQVLQGQYQLSIGIWCPGWRVRCTPIKSNPIQLGISGALTRPRSRSHRFAPWPGRILWPKMKPPAASAAPPRPPPCSGRPDELIQKMAS